MAIWPFGRKGKRSSSQFAGPETVEKISPSQGLEPGNLLDPGHGLAAVGRKPSRKRSKRHKSRPLTPPGKSPNLSRGEALSPPRRAQTSPQSISANQQREPVPSPTLDRKYRPYTFDERTTHPSIGQAQPSVSRAASLLQGRRASDERAVWRKKLSTRKANQIAREQEIRAMASSPVTIPKRSATFSSEHNPWDMRRGSSRNTNHHVSDISLPMRDSAGSSLSEVSESYTFKVNAFAALTPRPIIRCAESPRYMIPRSRGPSAASSRRDNRPMIPEEFDSKKRIDELADDLDAGALRELLERDRRRKEKKRLEDREKLQRKLQRRADRQREEERQRAEKAGEAPSGESVEEQRGRHGVEASTVSVPLSDDDRGRAATADSDAKAQSGSWLRSPSRESDVHSESANVVGNLDDSSIRGRQAQRNSLALSHLSQEMKLSRSSISLCHSPVRQTFSMSTSQLPGAARESASNLSQPADSEKRLSDHSGRRMNSWSSFFRRGGSRLKRGSWERRQGPPSEFSNASKESFSRLQTPPSGLPPAIPERGFLRTGTIHRSQSKFTEHLGDLPMSPPDSRLQSPDIPETISDMPSPSSQDCQSEGRQLDTTLASVAIGRDDGQSRHRQNWETNSPDAGAEGGFFSTSLASIDSEGSWMSGKYLRRISQATNNAVRQSIGSSIKQKLDEYAVSREADDVVTDEYFARLTPAFDDHRDSVVGTRRASSTAMGIEDDAESLIQPLSDPEPAEATWHRTEIGRRPTVVRPHVRPKSKSGLFNDVGDPVPASPEEASLVEEEESAPEIHRATSLDVTRGHARQFSAGSAKLLDISPRPSLDSKPTGPESTVAGDAP
ncbi:hypothetical protein VTN00DRAFT_9882 [Thermoascus crustaceus]|uniref:uncharacterized protein n=1 Tax=Thermoascus crustaceus TaxID=5088 RepID=UPI0037447D32